MGMRFVLVLGLCQGMRCKEKSRNGDESDPHVFQRVSALPEGSHPV